MELCACMETPCCSRPDPHLVRAPMTHTPTSASPSSKGAAFAVYVALVLTVAMVLFPPFTSVNGTEYAFLLTGPEGVRLAGLTPRLHWAALLVQLGAVWAIALGARWFFGRQPPEPKTPALLLGGLALVLAPGVVGAFLLSSPIL